MAKNILQDIVPPEKRSIRNIPLPNRGEKQVDSFSSARPATLPPPQAPSEDNPKVYPYEENRKPSFFRKKSIWAASIVALLIIIFSFTSLFAGATVTITPKQEVVASNGNLVLSAKQTASTGDVEYQVITLSKDLGKSVPASGEEHVEIKANGKIVIFNTYDANPQRLIKNTRFETPEGLIYRINESVVVPGRTGTGAQMSPGSVEVTVYADVPGDKYNIGLKDFTIPGFKSDPRFKAVYARSKTAMTGGFVGKVNKVSDADLASARTDLQTTLSEALKKEALAQVPEDFILYEDGMIFTFAPLPQTDPKGSSVTVNERGTLNGVIFNRKKLSEHLFSRFGATLPAGDVTVANLAELPFAIQNKESFKPSEVTAFTFTMTGSIIFVTLIDTNRIKADLLGQPKKNLETTLENYPAVAKANANVRPFWKRSFPGDAKEIEIKIVNPSSE